MHCDMNSFFASVELLSHPELKDKPVAVGGNAENRHGIILAKNDAAKRMGVQTAETLWQAQRKCPGLVILPPNHWKYHDFYEKINRIYLQYTDLVEPFSVDESWLDISGSLSHFHKSGKELADEIRERVKRETGLTQSVGVSFNKVFAKMGSDYKKPDATTVITRDNYKDIIWPLPCGDLFFVGRASAEKLISMNIRTIGDIVRADRSVLEKYFGKHGLLMYEYANGLDDEPVRPFDSSHDRKSVGEGMTFKRDLVGKDDISAGLKNLSYGVSSRLRRYGLKCSGVKLDIKAPNFISISRQAKLNGATDLTQDLFNASLKLFEENWRYQDPVRQLTVTAINLTGEGEESHQLSLFEEDAPAGTDEKETAIDQVLDEIKAKFGSGSVVFGNVPGNDIGITYKNRNDKR